MSVTLDRSNPSTKPVGIITGRVDKFPGARYEQGGLFFREDGSLCDGQEPAKGGRDTELDQIKQWVESQKGAKGKKALQEHAKELGLDYQNLGTRDLRRAIVQHQAKARQGNE